MALLGRCMLCACVQSDDRHAGRLLLVAGSSAVNIQLHWNTHSNCIAFVEKSCETLPTRWSAKISSSLRSYSFSEITVFAFRQTFPLLFIVSIELWFSLRQRVVDGESEQVAEQHWHGNANWLVGYGAEGTLVCTVTADGWMDGWSIVSHETNLTTTGLDYTQHTDGRERGAVALLLALGSSSRFLATN